VIADGTVYVFGGNYNGQLGIAQHKHHIGTPFKLDCFNEPVVSVSCGNNHVFYRLASGRVYSCGRNEYFESGVPMDTSLYAPVEVDFANHLPNGKTRVSSVFCGSWHSIFLTEDQQLYSSGINENGELGLGFKAQGRDKNRAVPSKMNVKYPVPVEPSRYEMKVACGSAHSILYFARKEQNVMRENLFRLLREDRQTFICTDLSIKTVN
jgi:alpha-tubulin suppressor-like RCC1 family protein